MARCFETGTADTYKGVGSVISENDTMLSDICDDVTRQCDGP